MRLNRKQKVIRNLLVSVLLLLMDMKQISI